MGHRLSMKNGDEEGYEGQEHIPLTGTMQELSMKHGLVPDSLGRASRVQVALHTQQASRVFVLTAGCARGSLEEGF